MLLQSLRASPSSLSQILYFESSNLVQKRNSNSHTPTPVFQILIPSLSNMTYYRSVQNIWNLQ